MAKNNLDALKKAWAKAKADAKEYSNPHFDDGHYLTKISATKVGQSKAGNDQLTIDFQFVEGEYTGKSKRTWWNLDIGNEQGLAITIGALQRLGLEDVEPETLESDIQQLIGKLVRIQLVTTISKKDGVTEYQNVRIEKVMGVDPDTANQAPVAEPELEDEDNEPEPDNEEEEKKPAKKSKSKGSEEAKAAEDDEDSEEVVEETTTEDEEEGVDITVGMRVSFTKKDGSEMIGTIDSIDEDNGTVVVKSEVNGVAKKFRVTVDRLSAL